MGAFEFTALDVDGRQRKGVMEGDAPRQIRQQLREQGWTPLSVEQVERREPGVSRVQLGGGVPAVDLAVFTRQLATLLGSGLPLEEALHVASQQTERPRLKSTLLAVRSRVKEGHAFAEALGGFPNIFPELYRATVAAGEQTGRLDAVLERLADYTENRHALMQSILQALVYPAVLTVVAIAVVSLLLGYVVPQVVGVFEDIGQELPVLTRALIAVSEFVGDFGLLSMGVVVLAAVAWRLVLRYEGVRERYHRALLSMPLVSRMVRGINAARFARTFSILTASGVPVLDGLRISASVMGNLPMRTAVQEAARRVREGASLNRALEKSGYFPPLTVHLIASGEASGRLEHMLERAAENQERELENRIGLLVKLFEPALILAMGVLVLLIVLAILLPIFGLNQLVK